MCWVAKKRMGFNIDEHHISDSSHFNDLVLCQLLLDYTIFGRDWKLNIWAFIYALLAYLNVSTAWACTAYLKISLLSKRVCIKFRLEKKYFSPQLRQNKPYYKKIQYNSCLFMQKVWKKGKKWAQTILLHTSQKGGKNGSVPKRSFTHEVGELEDEEEILNHFFLPVADLWRVVKHPWLFFFDSFFLGDILENLLHSWGVHVQGPKKRENLISIK